MPHRQCALSVATLAKCKRLLLGLLHFDNIYQVGLNDFGNGPSKKRACKHVHSLKLYSIEYLN